MKLSYEDFKECLSKELMSHFGGSAVQIFDVNKVNGQGYQGMVIRDRDICPVINLNALYEDYINRDQEDGIDGTVNRAIIYFKKHEGMDISTPVMTDWQQISTRLRTKIVNAAMNADLLEGFPHVMMADLAIYFGVITFNNDGNDGFIPITKEMSEILNVTTEDMLEQVKKNIYGKAMLTDLYGVCLDLKERLGIGDLELPSPDVPIVLIRTRDRACFGTEALLDKTLHNRVVDLIGDYLLIPSSVHEWLAVPADINDQRYLSMMVREVNDTVVAENEILSDHLYRFDGHELTIVNNCA